MVPTTERVPVIGPVRFPNTRKDALSTVAGSMNSSKNTVMSVDIAAMELAAGTVATTEGTAAKPVWADTRSRIVMSENERMDPPWGMMIPHPQPRGRYSGKEKRPTPAGRAPLRSYDP